MRNAASYDFGGGERFPVFLAQELQNLGHHPVVFSHHKTLLDYASSQNVPHKKTLWWSQQNWQGWRILGTPIYLVWQIILMIYYVVLFTSSRPGVVHLQSKDDFIAGTLAGKLLGARVVWTDHADLKHVWKNVGVWYKNPVGKLVRWAGRWADAITVVSNSELRLVSAHLAPNSPVASKLVVVHNGVADQYKKQSHDTSIFTFCIAGRLVVDKGIGEAIEAFSRFHSTHPSSQLILLGDGPDRKKFEQQVGGLPVIFRGHQSNPLPEIAATDVYLHPTYHEGFSVSLVEASMLGMPIIATGVGGNPEIIHDYETGLLIPAKDPGALYEAMEQLYANAALRQKIAKNARQQFLQKFVFSQIVTKQFIPLYNGTYEDSH